MNALAQLGMVSETFPEIQEPDRAEEAKDYFVTRDGVKFAGAHLLLDFCH